MVVLATGLQLREVLVVRLTEADAEGPGENVRFRLSIGTTVSRERERAQVERNTRSERGSRRRGFYLHSHLNIGSETV